MAHTFIESTMVRQNYQVWSWPRWSRLPLPIYCTQSNLQHCGSRWAFGWYCARSPSTATATSKRRVANVAERRSRRGSQPIIPPPPSVCQPKTPAVSKSVESVGRRFCTDPCEFARANISLMQASPWIQLTWFRGAQQRSSFRSPLSYSHTLDWRTPSSTIIEVYARSWK